MEKIDVRNFEEDSNLLIRNMMLFRNKNYTVSEIKKLRSDITSVPCDKYTVHYLLDLEHLLYMFQELKDNNIFSIGEGEVTVIAIKLFNVLWSTRPLFDGKLEAQRKMVKLSEIMREINNATSFESSIKLIQRRFKTNKFFDEMTEELAFFLINLYYYLYQDKFIVFFDSVLNQEDAIISFYEYSEHLV